MSSGGEEDAKGGAKEVFLPEVAAEEWRCGEDGGADGT